MQKYIRKVNPRSALIKHNFKCLRYNEFKCLVNATLKGKIKLNLNLNKANIA